jgi:uncharacterized protein involved in response to NO
MSAEDFRLLMEKKIDADEYVRRIDRSVRCDRLRLVPDNPSQEVEVTVGVVTNASKTWFPTRKWLAAQVVALGAIASSWAASGWDGTETNLMIAWVIQAAVTYLLPNQDTPGGVPLTTSPKP